MQRLEAILHSHMRDLIVGFAAGYGRSVKTVLQRSPARDGRFLERLESGKGFTVRTYDSMACYLVANWPKGHAVPPLPYLSYLVPPAVEACLSAAIHARAARPARQGVRRPAIALAAPAPIAAETAPEPVACAPAVALPAIPAPTQGRDDPFFSGF